jgi:PKHD-type hydroxylase|tara:strand:+ start:2933 stop:3526 length:594 start_codon:yes stop_codon:yes gene_type:complete
MFVKYHYWFFKGVLSDKFCDSVMKSGLKKNSRLGTVGGTKRTKDLKKKRNSNVAWLDDKWIYKEIHPYIHLANQNAGWNYHWDWTESCQFTKYSKGQFYDWHADGTKPYNTPKNINKHNKSRKLSVTVSLNDASEYEGGDLEFDCGNIKKREILKSKEIREKGSIVVFPSFVWHRVRPVKKGTRYSLVMWNLGHPFK